MPTITAADGTSVTVEGTLDPDLPLVVLLHGLSGNEMHMTAPLSDPLIAGAAYDRSSGFTVVSDGGWHFHPPANPLQSVEIDAPLTTVRSWRQALNQAGFPTLSYTQVAPSGPLAPNLAQLIRIVDDLLSNPARPDLAGMRVAFVAHSRGGILVRQFMAGATAAFRGRVVAAITLHSPHLGSGLATAAATVDTAVAAVQLSFAGLGITPPGFLGWIRSQVGSPAYPEIALNSPTLNALAAMEPSAPVPGGTEWHTFGGTSTWFLRLRARLAAPGSELPILILPIPLFHWILVTLPVGTAVDPLSFVPLPAPIPVLTELQVSTVTLAALTPELRNGFGDLLTADVACRLPFARTHTTNDLNHAEALYDRRLQGQVLAILERFRIRTPGPVTPGTVLVPDLLGLLRSAARSALEEAQLSWRFIGDAGAFTEVVSQAPAEGTPVATGTTVVVEMGSLD